MGKANRKTGSADREAITLGECEDNVVAEESEDEVAYGKPPKATRFQKGKSGNPSRSPRAQSGLLRVDCGDELVPLAVCDRIPIVVPDEQQRRFTTARHVRQHSLQLAEARVDAD
jgi:hypothetical protein